MGTSIRNSISESNPFYISKHEYLMTKHFALQYNEWKKQKNEIESRISYGFKMGGNQNGSLYRPVEKAYEDIEKYSFRMSLIEQAAKIAGEDIWEIILIGVTTECNYEYLRLVKNIPCCKDVYYRMYRKFYWILNRYIYNLLNGEPI